MIINGVINLNKREGISSFKAVREVRMAVGADKAGHTGTLDPMASGVLPVCLGKATRISSYIMQKEKEYGVTMLLGLTSDTYDLEGEISFADDMKLPDQVKIEEAVMSFEGKYPQMPPIYSAIKVNGRKLYDYARKGEDVEIKPREIEIKEINDIMTRETKYSDNEVCEVKFNVRCSKGTYIRSLCNDIGEKLGCGALMSGLVRITSGQFSISQSFSIEEVKKAAQTGKLDDIILKSGNLLELDIIDLTENETEFYLLGKKVVLTGVAVGEYLVKSCSGDTIGIGICDEQGLLKSRKRL